MARMDRLPYDEFGLFHENASEHGLPFEKPPSVCRDEVQLLDGRSISVLVWGDDPEVVFVHGGAQNAHTWDTTIMALGRSALAIDLPGHGHSDWRPDGRYSPRVLADDVATVITALAPRPQMLVGMSLGGLTSLQVATHHRSLVQALMLVDITPGVNRAKSKAVIDFVDGPQAFPSFNALLERTMQHNPTRSESSLRRGILHNAHQLDDGSWAWRYDRGTHARTADDDSPDPAAGDGLAAAGDGLAAAMSPLWDDFGQLSCPVALVRGALSPVVDDDDVAEALRRKPAMRVHVVEAAGHSVQGDQPLELARLIGAMLDR